MELHSAEEGQNQCRLRCLIQVVIPISKSQRVYVVTFMNTIRLLSNGWEPTANDRYIAEKLQHLRAYPYRYMHKYRIVFMTWALCGSCSHGVTISKSQRVYDVLEGTPTFMNTIRLFSNGWEPTAYMYTIMTT